MRKLRGFIASEGITCGRAYLYEKKAFDCSKRKPVPDERRDEEVRRFKKAVDSSKVELNKIRSEYLKKGEKELAHIFRSQLTIMEDEELLSDVEKRIKEEGVNAEYALFMVVEDYKRLFEELEDGDYIKERKSDLEDVRNRIIKNLLNMELPSLEKLPYECIIVATELFPSDTAEMDVKNVKGIVTEKGGITSHVSIIAKSLGIPALVGVKNVMSLVNYGDYICIDSLGLEKGELYINPDEDLKKKIADKSIYFVKYKAELEKVRKLKPVTKDGKEVIVSANIGSLEDFGRALDEGIKSVGLFRTEFLFLNSSKLPDEESQYRIYREVAERLKPGMVIIRTLDIGGDKSIASLTLPDEENPFLGLRAIRVGFKYPEMFKKQLRAILRASNFGNVKIMFPMISDVTEIRKIKEMIIEIKSELDRDGYQYDKNIEIGIMVEVPSAAVMSDVLAKEVDFFSIGTNDLTQYLLAADRLNENVSEYYRQFHPSIFRMIKKVVDSAINENKWVGVCGELGGNVIAIPILIGLGVNELSMESGLIPTAIDIIRSISFSEASLIAREILGMITDEEIISYMKDRLRILGKGTYL